MNVVVVSDEPVLATLVRRPLEPLGYTLSAVSSARELERQLQALAPRAAVLPRRLPDRSLADTVAMLREAAGPAGIAIIVVGTSTGDRGVARDVDADAFLQVPFTDAQVLDVLGASTRAKKLILLADDSSLIHRPPGRCSRKRLPGDVRLQTRARPSR